MTSGGIAGVHERANIRGRRIVLVGMEMKGFTPGNFKLGGLIHALAQHQAMNGASVRIYLPRTKDVVDRKSASEIDMTIHAHDERKVNVSAVNIPVIGEGAGDISVMLLGNEALFGSHSLYNRKDNWIYPWGVFAQAVLEHLRITEFKPDVIHCHEWQAGLLPVYCRVSLSMAEHSISKGVRVIYSQHDLKQLGLFPAEQWKYVGLPWDIFTHHWAEYFGQVCLLKAGMSANRIIFDSSEQLNLAISSPEPRGIGDYIKDKMMRGRVAAASGAKFDVDRVAEEYCASVSQEYFR